MGWTSSKLRHALEHGDFEIAADHYAVDAIVDTTVGPWRFQIQGRETIKYKVAEDFGAGVTFRRWDERAAPWGAVIQVEAVQGEGDAEVFFRWIQLLDIVDGKIVRDTTYCSGEWDRATIERWRREAPMIDA